MRRSSVLLVLASVAFACNSSSSGGGGGGGFDASQDGPVYDSSMEDAGDAGTCQAPGGTTACTSCLASKCASQSGAAQSACAAVVSCYCACQLGDATCVKACGSGVTSSCVSGACALADCAAQSCTTECTVASPGSCTSEAGGPDAAADASPMDSSTTDASDASTPSDTGTDAHPGSDGGVVTLATSTKPWGMALDANNVYWTAYDPAAPTAGVVLKVPLAGGAVTTLASGRNGPQPIVVDATNVYWGDAYGGFVMEVPIGGGTPTTLASVGGLSPYGMVVDATNVYWTGGALVKEVPIAGGAVTTIGTTLGNGNATGIAIQGTNLYWQETGSTVTSTGTIMKLPTGGGSSTTLVSGLQGPLRLAVDPNNFYFNDSNHVVQAPLAGGTPTTLVLCDPASAIASDTTNIYYDYLGTVNALPIGTMVQTVLATPMYAPDGPIAVNATNVYWGTSSSSGNTGAIETTGK